MRILKISGFFIILISLFLFLFITDQAQAALVITPADIQMTNYALVTGNNFGFQKVSVYTTNRLILGGCWSCSNFRDQIVSPGQYFTNKTWFTNLGNTNGIMLQFGVQSNKMNGTQGFLPWAFFTQGATLVSAGGTNMTGAKPNVFQRGFNPGQAFAIDFVVYISNNIRFANFTNVIRLWCTNVSGDQSPTGKTNYTGDNNVAYGGALGFGWGTAGNNGFPAANNISHNALFCITGQDVAPAAGAHNLISKQLGAEALYISSGPNITIIKSILSVTLKGIPTLPIPGATITFDIKVTNQGSVANNVVVRDTMQTNSMRYVGGSMTHSGVATWNTNVVFNATGVILYWTNQPNLPGNVALGGTHLEFKAIIR